MAILAHPRRYARGLPRRTVRGECLLLRQAEILGVAYLQYLGSGGTARRWLSRTYSGRHFCRAIMGPGAAPKTPRRSGGRPWSFPALGHIRLADTSLLGATALTQLPHCPDLLNCRAAGCRLGAPPLSASPPVRPRSFSQGDSGCRC